MKRFALALLVTVPVWGGFSSAGAESCVIREAPAPALKEYLKGVDHIISEAVRIGTAANCQNREDGKRTATADVDKAQSSVMGSVNKSLSSVNVMTSFRFTVNLIRRTELPAAIRRDHAQLDKRQRSLMMSVDSVAASCWLEETFSSNASPFASYSTQWRTVGDVLEDALSSHVLVMNLYREAVLWDEPASVSGIPVGPENFGAALKAAYGPGAIESCNTSGEGTFFERIKGAIDRLGRLGEVMQNGTKDWKEAWSMLRGEHKQQSEMEKRLLRQELWRQGISTSASDRALRNLDAYNRGEGWQGMNASIQGIGEAVNNGVAIVKGMYDETKSLWSEYAGGFEKIGQPKPEDAKNADEYLERYRNLAEIKTDVAEEIAEDYLQTLSFISDENVSTDNNLGQLVEMHVLLSKTLKAIDPYKKTSSEACKGQAKNMGGNCNGE